MGPMQDDVKFPAGGTVVALGALGGGKLFWTMEWGVLFPESSIERGKPRLVFERVSLWVSCMSILV